MHELRPFQESALHALASPCHLICVAPTGSGKSLIYEKMAKNPGFRTLLITPLVALARQQESRLRELGVPVSFGNAPPRGAQTGAWILSPESLEYPGTQATLRSWRPNFLVVDECHCLWEWGETFRPAFLRIPDLLKTLSVPRSLWLTATLPWDARQELRALLPEPKQEIGGFEVPKNIHLSIRKVSWVERSQALLDWVAMQPDSGIVFVSTREGTARVSRLIESTGRPCLAYHAGMSLEERRGIESSVAKRGQEIVVATSAFGMGMDFPHLKWAVLWQAPLSPLTLAQSIGRVGRISDGNISAGRALVLWDTDDFRLLDWTVQGSERRRADLRSTADLLHADGCRKAWLDHYFEREIETRNCGNCDSCDRILTYA